jgi:NDP-sugar pyrophosphorylase family protein
MMPILGKPFLFYQLDWLASQNVRRVILSIGYKGELISQAVGDGKQFGLSVTYADEGNTLRGTGGALRFVADLGLLEPGFFILYGDSYLPIDLFPVWQASAGGRLPTMTVMRNEGRWDKSNTIFRDGKVILYDKFASDPGALGMHYIDYGLSVLTREVIVDEIASGEICDLAHLLNRLSLEKRLRGHQVFERFYEVGTPEGLDDFESYICNRSKEI